eukprot:11871265-Heterocapsa_arctica.AAC.1
MGSTAGPRFHIEGNQQDQINNCSGKAALHPPPGCWADVRGENHNKVMDNRHRKALCRNFN